MAFTEFNTSPTFSGDGKQLRMTRRGTILGSEIETFYDALFPHSVAGVAQKAAAAPGFTGLNAVRFECRPFPPDAVITNAGSCGANTLATYDLYEAEIEYGVIEEDHGNSTDGETGGDPNADPVATLRRSVGGEFMSIPNRKLKWQDTGDFVQGEDISAGKVIPTIELLITLHRVPSVPYSTIRSLIGKVNSAAYMGAAQETMLFIGADITREITTESPQPYRVEYRFVERRVQVGGTTYGWNHLYDPDSGTWRKVTDTAGNLLYATGAFASLY